MTDEKTRQRLREIDEELAVLRDELGSPSDDPEDVGDAASALTNYEEQSALIENLQAERRRLLNRDGPT